MSYKKNKGYECWVDFLKGIAIVLVIAGHCNLPTSISNIIYFFHMPLFFLISGYLEKNCQQSFVGVFKKKAERLLYPYFTFGISIIAWNTLKNIKHTGNFTMLLYKRFIALIYGNYIWENNYEYIGTLWFLVALFCVTLIGNIINRIKQRKIRIFVSCIPSIAGFGLCYFEKLLKFRLPWCLDIALVAFVFYQLGIELKSSVKIKKYLGNPIISFAIIIFGIICGVMNLIFMKLAGYEMIKVDMLYFNYGCVLLFILSASMISIGLCGLGKKICDIKRFELIEHIGKQSLTVMVVHLYIIQILQMTSSKLLGGINYWAVFVLSTVLSVVLSFFIEKFLPYIYNFKKMRELVRKNDSEVSN